MIEIEEDNLSALQEILEMHCVWLTEERALRFMIACGPLLLYNKEQIHNIGGGEGNRAT